MNTHASRANSNESIIKFDLKQFVAFSYSLNENVKFEIDWINKEA